MTFQFFDQHSTRLPSKKTMQDLVSLRKSHKSAHNEDKQQLPPSTWRHWTNKRTKPSQKTERSLGKSSELHMTLSFNTVFDLSTTSQASARELDGFARHPAVGIRTEKIRGSYHRDPMLNAPQDTLGKSPAGSNSFDWESPAKFPKYDSDYKPGKLQRRNALHRAPDGSKVSSAKSNEESFFDDSDIDRRDSGAKCNNSTEDLQQVRRSSGEESQTFYTASSRNSQEQNEAGESSSSKRPRPLEAPYSAEISHTDSEEKIDSPLQSPKRLQSTKSWGSSAEYLSTPLHTAATAAKAAKDFLSRKPAGSADAQDQFANKRMSRNFFRRKSIDGMSLQELSPNNTIHAEDSWMDSQLRSRQVQEQEKLDRELCLQLQQDEEMEYQRRQEQSNMKTCIICTDNLHVLEFDIKPPTARCDHPIDTCHNCLQQWVASEFESKGWEHIKCPQCPEQLEFADMQAAADPEVFTR